MKRLTAALFLIFAVSSVGLSTTRYIAQSAGVFAGGTACNGQTAVTVATFNATTLAAGDIAYICGTITASAGTDGFLVPHDGGSVGNPVQLIFDTGAIVQAPYWGITQGGISLLHDYITLDGVNTGTVRATANGDMAANNQGGQGIHIGTAAHVIVKRVTVSGIYVHHQNGTTGGQPDTECIQFTQSASIEIASNTLSDCYMGIHHLAATGSVSSIDIHDNITSKTNWGVAILAGGGDAVSQIFIHANDITIGNEWDDTDPNYNHHNGIYTFTGDPLIGGSGAVTNQFIYNNYIHGAAGQSWTSTGTYFMSYNVDSTYIFNNILSGDGTTGDPANGYLALEFATGGQHEFVYNNTIIGSTTGTNARGIQPTCMFNADNEANLNVALLNNICTTVNFGILDTDASGTSTANNDLIYNTGFGNIGINHGTFYGSLAAWRGAGFDAAGSNSDPKLSGTYHLGAGSAAIGLGANLYSTCNGQPVPGLGALCFDKDGNARPSVGAWDAGAFNSTPSCTPSKVVYTAQPSNAEVGSTLGTVSVSVEDSGGNVCTSDASTVTLSSHSGSTAATLQSSSSLSKAASAGVATWTDLFVSPTTGTISIDAADGALTGATSSSITISCTPSKVVFTSQPGSTTIGSSLGTVTVAVQDSSSITCSADTSSVTIANKAATCSGMTLGGTATGSASAGVFTTSNLTENAAGACTLHATDGALTAADSSAFTISATSGGSSRRRVHR